VEAGGESFELPAAMDGAIPFRLGEGPFWPVGEVTSTGGGTEITVRAEDLSTFQELIGVGREAAIGNVVATRTDPYETIPFADACGAYVDHYAVPLGVVMTDPTQVEDRRRIARFALTGHYQPKDVGKFTEPGTVER
jgi:hypothetical protein